MNPRTPTGRGLSFSPLDLEPPAFSPMLFDLTGRPPLFFLASKTYYFGLFLSFRLRLSEIFASKVQARVLEELLNAPNTIFTQIELARRAGCSSSSVDRALNKLEKLEIVRMEKLSVNKIIALNFNNRIVGLLIQFNRDVKKTD